MESELVGLDIAADLIFAVELKLDERSFREKATSCQEDGMLDQSKVREKVVEIITRYMSESMQEDMRLKDETTLIRDLDIDEFDELSLIADLEEEFDVVIGDGELPNLLTVGSIVKCIERKIGLFNDYKREKGGEEMKILSVIIKVLYFIAVMTASFFCLEMKGLMAFLICLVAGFLPWWIWEKFFSADVDKSGGVTCCDYLDQCTCGGGEMCDACRSYYRNYHR